MPLFVNIIQVKKKFIVVCSMPQVSAILLKKGIHTQ